MRVLIINPPWKGKGYGTRSQNRIIKQRGDKYLQYPLFLGYAAAQLKEAGHEVFYIDSVIQEIDQVETCVEINRIKPDVIFMETTTPSIESDYKSINHMKSQTRARMIAAGPHVSYFPVESLKKCSGLDIVIKREFDTKIVNVLANLKELSVVKGIAYRNNGKIMDTGEGEFCDDLDALPFPDRDIVPYNWYLEAWYSKRPFINIMTSRGCPYQCTFCNTNIFGNTFRALSPENVIKEIELNASVVFGTTQLSLNELINLKAGDVVKLDNKVAEDLCLKVEGIAKQYGKPGVVGKKMAFQVS